MKGGKQSGEYRKRAAGVACGAARAIPILLSRAGLARLGTALLASASALLFAATAMGQTSAPVLNNAPTIALPSGCSSVPAAFALGTVVTGSGKTDLVMFCGTNILTLTGNGDGTFATATPKTTALNDSAAGSGKIALVDIDGDGNLDLVTDDRSCDIDVFLGNGDGTFQTPPVKIPEPDSCDSTSGPFFVGNFNADSKPDLALENSRSGLVSLTVFLNTSATGMPSFTHDSDLDVITSATQLVDGLTVGNFTGQSVQDLAAGISTFTSSGTTASVEVFGNNGSGTGFTSVSSLTLPQTPDMELTGIAAGDFNGDGKEDLAAADSGDGAILILYGDGAGNLSSCSASGKVASIASCQTPAGQAGAGQTIVGLPLYFSTLQAGNFNGLPGLLFPNRNDGISVLLGTANKTLQTTATNYVAGPLPSTIILGDVNGDGFPDAIVATENNLSVFLNNTGGILEGTQAFVAGTAPGQISLLQNFFGNGEPDVAVVQNGGAAITVLGTPAGGLNGTLGQSLGPEPVVLSSTASITASVSGCLNNSSPCLSPFVATATYDTATKLAAAYIVTGGTGGPSSPLTISTDLSSQPVTAMAAADFNGDGNTDLVFAIGNSNTIEVFAGEGAGAFASPQTFSVGANPVALAVANFHGAGMPPDIAVLNQNDNTVGILLNNSSTGSISFQPMVTYQTKFSTAPAGMTVGDFNGDGEPDIAIVSSAPSIAQTSGLTILLNQGSGIFLITANSPMPASQLNGGITTADFNGDGNLDLAVTSSYNGTDTVNIFTGDGTGNFATVNPPTFSAGNSPVALISAQFTQDGKPDVAVADESGSMVAVTLNGTAAATAPSASLTITSPISGYSSSNSAVAVVGFGALPDELVNIIEDGSILLGTAGADDAGNFITGPFTLTAGAHTLTAMGQTSGRSSAPVDIAITAPMPPTLLSPSNGATNQSTTPMFSWTGVSGATSYQIVAASTPGALPTDPNSTTCSCVIETTVAGTSYTPGSGALLAGTTYYWEVQARNGPSEAWSVIFNFTTQSGSSQTITVPEDNETISVTDTPSFPTAPDSEPITLNDTPFVTLLIGVGAPVISFSPSTVGFGSVAAGAMGAQVITVSNIGEGQTSLALTAVSSLSPPFSLGPVTCSNGATSVVTTLPSGGACQVTIQYQAPSPIPAPAPTAALTFTDNAALSNLSSTVSGPSFTQAVSLDALGSSSTSPQPSASVPVNDNEMITTNDAPPVQTVMTSATALVSSHNPSQGEQPVMFTATVTSVPAGGGTPTGTVTFYDGLTPLGTGPVALNGSGVAILTTSTLIVSSHSITAIYGGDANFASSESATLTQVISGFNTITTLTSSLAPSVAGQTITLTATVPGFPDDEAPTGTVTFSDSSANPLATTTVTLISGANSGVATLTTSSLALGSHSIVATYNGDTIYGSSSSSPLSQIVVGFVPLQSNPTVTAGNHVTISLALVNPSGSGWTFTDFVCSSTTDSALPAGTACSGFNPTSVSPGTPQTGTTLSFIYATTGKGTVGPRLPRSPWLPWTPEFCAALAALLAMAITGLRRTPRWRSVFCMCLVVVIAAIALASCGSGPSEVSPTAPGNYTFVVTGTAAGSGTSGGTAISTQVTVTVTAQP